MYIVETNSNYILHMQLSKTQNCNYTDLKYQFLQFVFVKLV